MTPGDWINVVLTLVTTLMAIATGLMAWWTHKLAKETKDSLAQSDRHHEEDQRPFCIAAYLPSSDGRAFGHLIVPNFGVPAVIISGEIHNKGNGIAVTVLAYLNARKGPGDSGVFRLTRPIVVSSIIGSRETVEMRMQITPSDIISKWNGKEWQPIQTSVQAIMQDAYELILEYRDASGNIFRTVHQKGLWQDTMMIVASIGDPEKLAEMMIQPDRPTPIFLKGKQSPRTLADFCGNEI